MYQVKAEHTQFFFVPLGYSLDSKELPLEAERPDDALIEHMDSDHSRLALFPSLLKPTRGRFYLLYWPGDVDLLNVDRRVIDGVYCDEDFERAFRAIFQQTLCDSCGRSWPTLIIPPGDPYPGAPGLLERKVATAAFVRCPTCNAPFRQMVLKILKSK